MCIQLGVSIPLYLAAKDMYTMIADSTNISIKYLHDKYTRPVVPGGAKFWQISSPYFDQGTQITPTK